jgi:hypothetical protein
LATKALAQLQGQMTGDAFVAAQERGKALQLDAVVAGFLHS